METETPTCDDRENAFAAAAEALEQNVRTPLLCQIIERRAVINRLRAKKVAWQDITTLLCEFGITIAPGTLRNYASRIALAVCELEATREEPPTVAHIYELCCLRARPAGGAKNGFAPRSATRPLANRVGTLPQQSFAIRPTPKSALLRNHKEKL